VSSKNVQENAIICRKMPETSPVTAVESRKQMQMNRDEWLLWQKNTANPGA
jgi:hypothetical protein